MAASCVFASLTAVRLPLRGGRVFVFGNDESYDVMLGLMISRITVGQETVPALKSTPE
jgi:hypothetical protein